jgi:hypothetical protein
MPCNASYARFIFLKVFHKYYNFICAPICIKSFIFFCKKWVLQFHPCSASPRQRYATCNSRSRSGSRNVPLWRMAFSCLSSSACSPYVVNRKRCWMTVLTVLCYMLNMYYMYLAIADTPTWKWGALGSDTAAIRGPPGYESARA